MRSKRHSDKRRDALRFESARLRAVSSSWSFRIGHQVYQARHLHPWHIAQYQKLRYEIGRSDRARDRRAASWLLRCTFPWRLSYVARGDPVHQILEGNAELRSRALGEILAHTRRTANPNTLDKTREA